MSTPSATKPDLRVETFAIRSDADRKSLLDRLAGHGKDDASARAVEEKVQATRHIVDAVRKRGDAAVAEFTTKFDHVSLRPDEFEISPAEIEAAYSSIDNALRASLQRAHDNIRAFHASHLRESWEERRPDGSIVGQRITPIDSVGVYIPGGKAFYPSSALMNIVPARVAGVPEVIMVTPPSYRGSVHPVALAAAKIAGVSRVFRVGGAQAVAALAYGTATIPQVLKITGPGNTYVTAAKRLIRGVCDIDTEAGPSEVTVIADAAADVRRVATELLAQSEHDEEACSILVTTSAELAEAVQGAIENELGTLDRAAIIRQSLNAKGLIIVARDIHEAVLVTNWIAPEHLAIYTADPRAVLEGIRNAGCIVLGENSTVVHGDYFAGPNHTLPTGRRARFSSPLSAEDFRKMSSIIEFTAEGAAAAREDILRLANAEGLTAHARAIEIRE